MARRGRRRDDLAVSLFPFLSVLACVIGTLTLLLAAIAVGRLGGPSFAWIRLAEELEALEEALAAGEARLEQLTAQLREHTEREDEEAEIGQRLTALGLSPRISLEEVRALTDRARALEALRERRRVLEGERTRVVARVARDEESFAARRARRDAAPIIIEPSGLGRHWLPFLVECTADYVELYDAADAQSSRVPRNEMGLADRLPKFLRFVANTPRSIVIFLIRPDGLDTCADARGLAERYLVRWAELPLPGGGPLDLSRMADGA